MRRRRRAAACLRTKVRWVAEDRVRLEDRAGSLKISGPEVAQCLPMVRGELCEAGSRIFREVWVTDFCVFGYTRRDKLFIFVGVGVFHPLSRRFLASSGEPGSFERVETPPRLERLLRKKVGTETTRRRITAAPMPPHSMRGQLFCCPHFLPAVDVSTTNHQQLLAPPVPRSCCNHCLSFP